MATWVCVNEFGAPAGVEYCNEDCQVHGTEFCGWDDEEDES
jgi:hypothetical protein